MASFSLIVIACIYAYTYTILNIIWSCPWNVACMCVFGADYLALANQLVYSSLRKNTSTPPSFLWLMCVCVCVCVCVCLRSHVLFSIQFCIPIGVGLIQLTFGQLCWWDFMSAVSDVTRWYRLPTNSLVLWISRTSPLLFYNVPWSLDAWMLCSCIHGDWAPQLWILTGCDFL
jgi:hypothetical protein